MATTMLRDLKQTGQEATDAAVGQFRRKSSRMTGTEIAVAVAGAAAVAGLIAAAVYYTPDLVRYLKIRRM